MPLWLTQAGPDPRIIAAAHGLQGYHSKSPEQRKSVIRSLLTLGTEYLPLKQVPPSANQGSNQGPSFHFPAAQAAASLRPALPNLDTAPASHPTDHGHPGASQSKSLFQQPGVARQPKAERTPSRKPLSPAGPATTLAKESSKQSPAAAPERSGLTVSEVVAKHGPPEVICFDLETTGTICSLQHSSISCSMGMGLNPEFRCPSRPSFCHLQCRAFETMLHCPDGHVPHYRGGRKGAPCATPIREDSGI